MRRVRVHQAWYRANVLGLARYGSLAVSKDLCGTVLVDEDAERWLNFVGPSAVTTYAARREVGWGVDPVRCTKYLTSSQTLTFNMLSEVVRHPKASARLFNAMLGRDDLAWLESADFEFSGVDTPYWLGDRTFIDLLLRFRRTDGGLQVVAVETKLADRFSTRRTAGMGGLHYQRVTKHHPIWRDLQESLDSNATRQMTRCHALAQSVQVVDSGCPSEGAVLLMLLHPGDLGGCDQAQAYVAGLSTGEAAFSTWDAFLHAAGSTNAMAASLRRDLRLRYIDMSLSESAWSDLSSAVSHQRSGRAEGGDSA
jgi:PD-(D/E)XK nuclease superfamily